MGRTSNKKSSPSQVPYHGQRPHVQGKHPNPLLYLSVNLKNAIKRARFNTANTKPNRTECRTQLECLMDVFMYDLNQLIIYESRKTKLCGNGLIRRLRSMKTSAQEVKQLANSNEALARAENVLKRWARLKCTTTAMRKQLFEFMASDDPRLQKNGIVCEFLNQLRLTDIGIERLCKSGGWQESPCPPGLARSKRGDCGDIKNASCKAQPSIFDELTRPYDPKTDEDSGSIHLRYIPTLDSFKAHMAQNPAALRLPLMCPQMKRIMNKMKASYLMDDVPTGAFVECPDSCS